jgi:hypothetical protein
MMPNEWSNLGRTYGLRLHPLWAQNLFAIYDHDSLHDPPVDAG